MELEPAEESDFLPLEQRFPAYGLRLRQVEGLHVHFAVMPNGRRIRLLKTLLTSACERDCLYCPFRAGRDFRRATLRPAEMAQAFMALYRCGVVEGLFLSSGIVGGSVLTQDNLLATAEILRFKLGFRGYLHLKLMPGAEEAQIERAMQLADRLSLNLEVPTPQHITFLAPSKVFEEELMRPLQVVEHIRRTQPPERSWKGRWPSLTTQFVVGPAGESDAEILNTTMTLQRKVHLSRAYFSAFRPVVDTPLENVSPTHPKRELRLYQASFLLRDYGFSVEELPFDAAGNLPLEADPKWLWAQRELSQTPLEINRASYLELLRLPGVGPKGAKAIVQGRRMGKLRSVEDLRRLGVNPQRTLPFILINGRRPIEQRQLRLF